MVTNSGQSQSDGLQILNTKTENLQTDHFKNKLVENVKHKKSFLIQTCARQRRRDFQPEYLFPLSQAWTRGRRISLDT